GLVQIRGYVTSADNYSAMQRLVTLRAGLDPLIEGVQAERALAARRADDGGVDARDYRDLTRATDTAAAGVVVASHQTSPGKSVVVSQLNDAATFSARTGGCCCAIVGGGQAGDNDLAVGPHPIGGA
ncbi:hypothetical protein K7G98_33040, partial [Saccharothrix sp. MB29]|nr:hypothetical protein [Saccharothrix sp. MB29]